MPQVSALLRSCVLFTAAFTLTIAAGYAQSEPFSLPTHRGAMLLDLDGVHITQSSAKPNGNELGIRAHDDGHMDFLAFLFLTPNDTAQTANSCRMAELDQITKDSKGAVRLQSLNPDKTDTPDIASMRLIYPSGEEILYRYSGSGDQCLTVEVYADKGYPLDQYDAFSLLHRQSYDPVYAPTPKDKFLYAEVLYRTEQYAAAVPFYRAFLATDAAAKDLTMRRVATDDMGISLGLSGQFDAARKIFNDAIQRDPDYPLNYYNLACADAEQGNAKDARLHLQQAFDRKAHTLHGEHMPDPAQDDSILKLKNDKAFWAFVQSLSNSL